MSEDVAEIERVLTDHGWRLERELGRGASSRVYRATQVAGDETVAVKVWRPEFGRAEWKPLFLREMKVHEQLRHPSILHLHATGVFEDRLAWLVMEYAPGPNLDELVLSSEGRLAPRDAVSIVLQVLDALDFAHRYPPPDGPFVHRDVKPGNVLVAGQSGDYHAKLADFGLAKNYELAGRSQITTTGTIRGTLEYMPPEQALDSKYAGPEVDVFATGAVLYYCLCGQIMYDYKEETPIMARLNDVQEGRTVPLRRRRPDTPPPLLDFVDRATHKERRQRFRRARDMAAALREVAKRL